MEGWGLGGEGEEGEREREVARGEVERLRGEVEEGEKEKKELLLVVFQRFTISIGNHLAKVEGEREREREKEERKGEGEGEGEGEEEEKEKEEREKEEKEKEERGKEEGVEDVWMWVVCGHMLEIGRKYYIHISPILETLSNNLFTEEVDKAVLEVFHDFRRLAVVAAVENDEE